MRFYHLHGFRGRRREDGNSWIVNVPDDGYTFYRADCAPGALVRVICEGRTDGMVLDSVMRVGDGVNIFLKPGAPT